MNEAPKYTYIENEFKRIYNIYMTDLIWNIILHLRLWTYVYVFLPKHLTNVFQTKNTTNNYFAFLHLNGHTVWLFMRKYGQGTNETDRCCHTIPWNSETTFLAVQMFLVNLSPTLFVRRDPTIYIIWPPSVNYRLKGCQRFYMQPNQDVCNLLFQYSDCLFYMRLQNNRHYYLSLFIFKANDFHEHDFHVEIVTNYMNMKYSNLNP